MASMSRKDFLQSIRDRIASGEWPPGTKLPSTSQFVEKQDVGATLVNEAFRILIETGEVVTRPGPGGARYVAGGEQSEHTGEITAPPPEQ